MQGEGQRQTPHHPSLKQFPESNGNGSLELHVLVSHGVDKAQQEGMQAKTVQGVVAIAILGVATDGMPHVSRMYTNLILPTRL